MHPRFRTPRGASHAPSRFFVAVFLTGTVLFLGVQLTGCQSSTSPSVTAFTACSDSPGTICTWAGNGTIGFNGNGKSLLSSALYWPIDLTFTSAGDAYIVDWNNHRLRHVTTSGKLVTVVGGSILGDGPTGETDANDKIPPGAPGTEVALNHPTDVKEMPNGLLLLDCWHNHKLRTYDPVTGLALVVCGAGAGFAGDGGLATAALINQPSKVAVAPNGDIYVLDQRNERIRKIAYDTGDISTVVGSGIKGFDGDGGTPLACALGFPNGPNPAPGGGIALDPQGRIYIADSLNNRIRRVDQNANIIETIAGSDTAGGYAGDGGPALAAKFNYPFDIEFGPDGRLYVADQKNNRVRAIDLDTGIIVTVAGNGVAGFSGDGGDALDAELDLPSGLAFDSQGHLYIADTNNNRIRRVTL